MKPTCRRILELAALLMVFSAVGCGGTGRFDVVVNIDSDYKDANGLIPAVEVRLTGASEMDRKRLSGVSVEEIIHRPPGKNTYVMKFGQGLPTEQTLVRSDRIWKRWKEMDARYLFVFADLPGVENPKGSDPRRLGLSIEKSNWKRYGWYWPFLRKREIAIVIEAPPMGVSYRGKEYKGQLTN